jgi:hypothetical protein
MNDIINDLSQTTSQDQDTVSSAWEFAKKQALSKYSNTDEEYFPYVTALTKQLVSQDQQDNPIVDNEKESMFSDPAPNTSYAPKQNTNQTQRPFMQQEKVEDISDKKDRNPKYCQTEIIFDMIEGLESKGICDEEIVHSLGMRLKVSPQEAFEILSMYKLSGGKDQIVDLGKDVDSKSFTIIIKEAKVKEADNSYKQLLARALQLTGGYEKESEIIAKWAMNAGIHPRNLDMNKIKALLFKNKDSIEKERVAGVMGWGAGFFEAKVKEDDGTVMSGSFDAAPFDGGRNRNKWKSDWDSQSKKCCKPKKKNIRLVDLSYVDQ